MDQKASSLTSRPVYWHTKYQVDCLLTTSKATVYKQAVTCTISAANPTQRTTFSLCFRKRNICAQRSVASVPKDSNLRWDFWQNFVRLQWHTHT